MEEHEKQLLLESLTIALNDLDKIIDSMKKNSYSETEINEYIKKRWNIWNEIHQVKKS
jgi:hypothetical protein